MTKENSAIARLAMQQIASGIETLRLLYAAGAFQGTNRSFIEVLEKSFDVNKEAAQKMNMVGIQYRGYPTVDNFKFSDK